MNRAVLQIAALVLPLIGLGGMWLSADRLSRQGTEWDVPIRGYDPRDLLQGHYVQFQYDWPIQSDNGRELPAAVPNPKQCIYGRPPHIDRVVPGVAKSDCKFGVLFEEAHQGRLYTSQAEALRLQKELSDPAKQGMVRIRLRPDGHITPLRITFRPRQPEPQAAP